MGTYPQRPTDLHIRHRTPGLRGAGATLWPPAPRVCGERLGSVEPHRRRCENRFGAVKSEASKLAGNGGVPENPPSSRGPFPLLFSCPPLVALCKHLLTHIFVSTIAFLTANFRVSSQDKGICEQTEIFIVVFCLAECSPSNICLCDTLGLPRAVGCPSAARPGLGDAHQRDLLPSHLAAALAANPQAAPFSGFPPGPLASPCSWV